MAAAESSLIRSATATSPAAARSAATSMAVLPSAARSSASMESSAVSTSASSREPGVADEYLVVLYLSPDPLPGHRLERSRPGHVDRSILDPEMIGSGERLFGVNLDGRPKLRFRQ